jgi:MFS family permease
MDTRAYLRVLRLPGAPQALGAWAMSGLTTALPLALILRLQTQHSYGEVGAVVAAVAVARAAAGPFRGRRIDRSGSKAILPQAALSALALAALAAFASGPTWLLASLAGLGGFFAPPIHSSLRLFWGAATNDPRLVKAGYAMQAVASEFVYIGSPLIVGAVAATLTPSAALYAVIGGSLCGAVAFARVTSDALKPQGADEMGGWLQPMAGIGMRVFTAGCIPLGMAFGAIDVGVPAFTAAGGHAAAAGVALASFALGSMVGGVVYGAVDHRLVDEGRFPLLVALFAFGLIPLPLAGGLASLLPLLALSGIFVAPVVTTMFELVDHVSARSVATAAWTWVSGAYSLGVGIGAWVCGVVATSSTIWLPLGLPCVFGFGALLVFWAGRKELRPDRPVRDAPAQSSSSVPS